MDLDVGRVEIFVIRKNIISIYFFGFNAKMLLVKKKVKQYFCHYVDSCSNFN